MDRKVEGLCPKCDRQKECEVIKILWLQLRKLNTVTLSRQLNSNDITANLTLNVKDCPKYREVGTSDDS